ncbi:MAG: folylpolyglutamate synthase/dihydrofolate synthase family protein [Bowdeniella nasicola]|nr:folylpolyglutamate synthase/dihydrofolate synthase family protein [Bowdeniella nasicola]
MSGRTPEESSTSGEDQRGADVAESGSAHDAALTELLSSPLLAGPDPAIVADVRAQDSAEEAREQAALDLEVSAIYEKILTRAPEHDFDPSISRMQRACELLGDPQDTCPVVHITGTNGKTSTARMVEALLAERGLRVGRFTSPHLHDVRERLVIDGEPITAQRFVDTYHEIEPFIEMVDAESRANGGPQLSFFEVFTLMAFAAFASAPVDVMVLEVGMGGRWDATNVANADVAVLTPIARDHERYLGTELTEIAGEKVGIITEGSTVISVHQREEVAPVIAQACAEAGARLVCEGADMHVLDRQVAVGGQFMSLRTPAATYTDILLSLHGAHQAHNALVALAATEALFGGAALSGEVVERAFQSVRSPGRLEVVRTSPTVIVDAAHNPHGVAAVVETLGETFTLSRLVAVVGVLKDKNAEAMLAELEPHVAAVVCTQVFSERAMDASELAEIAREVFDPDLVHVAASLADAIDQAATLAESGGEPAAGTGVLVIGSVYLAAAAREVLGQRKA